MTRSPVLFGSEGNLTMMVDTSTTLARTVPCGFSSGPLTHLELRGRDRAKFLHNLCSNDIKALPEGGGCEAFFCNVKGRVLFHARIFAGATAHWIEASTDAEAAFFAHLDRYLISEDVQIESRTAQWGAVELTGPRAEPYLATLGGPLLDGAMVGHAGDLQLRRSSRLGPMGWLVCGPKEKVDGLRAMWTAAGLAWGDGHAWETLRVSAGWPLAGRDFSDEQLAQELARTPQAISFQKGCYLGQEPIARLDAMGHTNRELRRVCLAGCHVIAAGAAVISPTGETVGQVTSGAEHSIDGVTTVIAMCRKQAMATGTEVQCGSATGVVQPMVTTE